jgi:8-oxo-dGTP pyrophosphatase MutT (NUDIX family)
MPGVGGTMTLHADARAVLAAWEGPNGSQDALRSLYLEHLDEHPDAMLRSCHPDHLTASALVMSHDHRRTVLTLHPIVGRWLQTGGHCESHDATLADAALREAREETGIQDLSLDPVPVMLSRHEVPCGPLRPSHHLDVQFVAVAPAGALPVRSEESLDLDWFPLDDPPEPTDQSLRDLIAAASSRLRGTPSP